jgi:methanogenic corrinoid protein MtbC1
MKNLSAQKICTIKYAANKSGLSPALIRIWESRYQAIEPARTPSKRRLFSKSDIFRLQLLKKAVDSGHSISQIANLSSKALMHLINADHAAVEGSNYDIRKENDVVLFYETALDSIIRLDAPGLKSTLEQASVHLTKLELINAVIVPVCKRVGELWRQGKLKIINEHMATPIIRSVLWRLLDSLEVSDTAPRIVIATPLNHRHELGALTIALVARESGWSSSYFGASLPADEIAAAAKSISARAVALSITFSSNKYQLLSEIRKIRDILYRDTALLIGGQGAATIMNRLDGCHVQFIEDLGSLGAALDNLLKQDQN